MPDIEEEEEEARLEGGARQPKSGDIKRSQGHMRKHVYVRELRSTERDIRTPKPSKPVDPPFPPSVDSRLPQLVTQ